MEASRSFVNPFDKYQGIHLNDRRIQKFELNSVKAKDDFEGAVIDFCRALFDGTETIFIQTSGSTGAPQNLAFEKAALIQSALATNEYFGLDGKSTALLSLPLVYVAARLMVVRAIIGKYNLLTVTPTANPMKEISVAISFVPMTPHQAKSVVANSPSAFEGVETVLLGGGEISSELKSELAACNASFYVGFGMAETLTHIALSKITHEAETTYKLMPDVHVDRDDRGCMVINRNGITKENLITNDLIELVEGGFKWLGRIDNLINSGGVKIIPEEVEKVLEPAINSNFFVAGIPDAVLGEKVALFIEGNENPDMDKIEFETAYQKPKKIISVPDFSYTISGKIKRKETVKSWLDATDG